MADAGVLGAGKLHDGVCAGGVEGSALSTALLTVCSYAPYVVMSIFAGTLSDRWNKKKTLLVCDALAALTTIAVILLLKTGNLRI